MKLSVRARRIALVALGILVLAALIFALSSLSPLRKSPKPKQELTAAQQAADLARQAEDAESRADTSTARSLAGRALQLDAGNKGAQAVIERIDAAEKAASRPATPTAAATPDAYSTALKDIKAALVPARSDWTRGAVVAQGAEALVTFEPVRGTAAYDTALRVVCYVHDRGSVAAAPLFLTGATKKAYPKDGADLRVGSFTGYFGTDGSQLADVTFVRGRYAFEVVAAARPGVSPASLKSVALGFAGSFPAAR